MQTGGGLENTILDLIKWSFKQTKVETMNHNEGTDETQNQAQNLKEST
jgi:hypothetical protein